MTPWRVLGSSVLVASLIGNVVLAVRSYRQSRVHMAARSDSSALAVDAEQPAAPITSGSLPAPRPLLASHDLQQCVERLRSSQHEAEELSERIRQILPPYRVFQMGLQVREPKRRYNPLSTTVGGA
jgi:hypothetical protein